MRIQGSNGINPGPTTSGTRRAPGSGFSLPETTTTAEARPAQAPRAAAGIDALLALQGIEDPTERRRRSVQRGRNALDVLDGLKISLLAGSFDAATVTRLRGAAAALKQEGSGDPGLDAVLSEIELRVEVELAKAGQV